MQFIIGPPPDDPRFAPEEGGWQKLRELNPRALVLIGSFAGLPLAALIGYGWSRVPRDTELAVRLDVMTLGPWSMLLVPLLAFLSLVVFFAALILIHELIHVLACPHFGFTSDTVFGVWPSRILAYANHSGPISLLRGIVIGTGPFLVLSVAPLFLASAGGPHWPLLMLVSVVNALLCGGDAVICMMLLWQVPFTATLRNKGWDTWWRPAQKDAEPD